MKIKSLTVCNFRNLKRQTLSLCDNLNVFFGANAQGKTNLLESVYFCCLAKSPRTDKDKDLICWNEENAEISCLIEHAYGDSFVEVFLSRQNSKKIKVNGNLLSKTSQLLGQLNCVFFSPQEIRIISQSPQDRRRFLDVDLCQLDKTYFFALSRYNKTLIQRNNLLKSDLSKNEIKNQIDIWDKQLAECGAIVSFKRKQFCKELAPFAKKTQLEVSANTETLVVDYVSQLKGESESEIYRNFLDGLQNSFDRDFEKRYTTIGCHRDDVDLHVNGISVRSFGSCGQQRTCALSLKIAETEIFKNRTGEYPVLLLDDVLSELDEDRQNALLNFSNNIQVILTTAVPLPESARKNNVVKEFCIKDGQLTNND